MVWLHYCRSMLTAASSRPTGIPDMRHREGNFSANGSVVRQPSHEPARTGPAQARVAELGPRLSPEGNTAPSPTPGANCMPWSTCFLILDACKMSSLKISLSLDSSLEPLLLTKCVPSSESRCLFKRVVLFCFVFCFIRKHLWQVKNYAKFKWNLKPSASYIFSYLGLITEAATAFILGLSLIKGWSVKVLNVTITSSTLSQRYAAVHETFWSHVTAWNLYGSWSTKKWV